MEDRTRGKVHDLKYTDSFEHTISHDKSKLSHWQPPKDESRMPITLHWQQTYPRPFAYEMSGVSVLLSGNDLGAYFLFSPPQKLPTKAMLGSHQVFQVLCSKKSSPFHLLTQDLEHPSINTYVF